MIAVVLEERTHHMSVRSKKAQNKGIATNGSLYSSSIDLKPGVWLPHSESVGVQIVGGDPQQGAFFIKMYYGTISGDSDIQVGHIEDAEPEDKYLRFRVNYLDGYESQSTVGNMIRDRIAGTMRFAGFTQYNLTPNEPTPNTHMGKRVHVCGDEAASYFVQVFLSDSDRPPPTFEQIAMAIAGVAQETASQQDPENRMSFKIGDDGYQYFYTVSEKTESSAVMRIQRR